MRMNKKANIFPYDKTALAHTNLLQFESMSASSLLIQNRIVQRKILWLNMLMFYCAWSDKTFANTQTWCVRGGRRGERGRQKEKQKHKIKGQCLNGIIAHSVDSVNSNTCKILAQKTANSTDTGADSTTTIIWICLRQISSIFAYTSTTLTLTSLTKIFPNNLYLFL